MVGEQAAADAEEEEHLAYLASRDRVWATLLQLGDVRADRPAERDAIIKALERVDPKVGPPGMGPHNFAHTSWHTQVDPHVVLFV